MRILIVGAGIGGSTLAALLEGRSHAVDLIERSADSSNSGYALSVWPLGSRILIGLGLIDGFRAMANPLVTYHLRNGAGHDITTYELSEKIAVHGDAGTLSRKDLLALLQSKFHQTHLRMSTHVQALEQTDHDVTVTFNDQSQATYDLVVGADGIHSSIRQMIAGEVKPHETGWGGWVWWAPSDVVPVTEVTEYWGAGRFLGLYPCPEQLCVFAGGPLEHDFKHTHPSAQDIRDHFAAIVPTLPAVFDALPADASKIFFWKLDARRSGPKAESCCLATQRRRFYRLPVLGLPTPWSQLPCWLMSYCVSRRAQCHVRCDCLRNVTDSAFKQHSKKVVTWPRSCLWAQARLPGHAMSS